MTTDADAAKTKNINISWYVEHLSLTTKDQQFVADQRS